MGGKTQKNWLNSILEKNKTMKSSKDLMVEYFKEVSTKNAKYYSFYGQFDFCIIGPVIYFVSNSAGGIIIINDIYGSLEITFEYDDIYYLSKSEAEKEFQQGVLLSIYGSDKLADWKNNKIVASYIEKNNRHYDFKMT